MGKQQYLANITDLYYEEITAMLLETENRHVLMKTRCGKSKWTQELRTPIMEYIIMWREFHNIVL